MNECVWKLWWNDTDRLNQSTWRKTFPSAIWSATNPTGTGLGLNLGLYSKKNQLPESWHSHCVRMFITDGDNSYTVRQSH